MDPADADVPSPSLAHVRQLIDAARQRVASAVNAELTHLYWQIGRETLQAELHQFIANVRQTLGRDIFPSSIACGATHRP